MIAIEKRLLDIENKIKNYSDKNNINLALLKYERIVLIKRIIELSNKN